jgi:hypothetical protein
MQFPNSEIIHEAQPSVRPQKKGTKEVPKDGGPNLDLDLETRTAEERAKPMLEMTHDKVARRGLSKASCHRLEEPGP